MTDREIMQQALAALNTCDWDYDSDESPHKTFDEDLVNAAAAALKEALAEPEQEAVCDKDPFYCWSIRCQVGKVCKHTAPSKPDLSIEANRVAYDVAMHYANKTKEQLG